MSTQCVYHRMNMLLTYTLISPFQPLLPDPRPTTSCYVMCHVTAVMYSFIVQEIK